MCESVIIFKVYTFEPDHGQIYTFEPDHLPVYTLRN